METDAEHAYYGFPMLPEQPAADGIAATPAQGVKVARHHGGADADPDTLDREVSEADEENVRVFTRRYMPLADGRRLDAKVCMYTNTPDENFVLGLDPRDDRVVIASPCSGHGFKFSNIVGADLRGSRPRRPHRIRHRVHFAGEVPLEPSTTSRRCVAKARIRRFETYLRRSGRPRILVPAARA